MDIVKSIRLKLPVKIVNTAGTSAQQKQIKDFENDLICTVEEINLAPLFVKIINSMSPTGRVPDVVDGNGVVTTPGYDYIDLHEYPTVTDGTFTKV